MKAAFTTHLFGGNEEVAHSSCQVYAKPFPQSSERRCAALQFRQVLLQRLKLNRQKGVVGLRGFVGCRFAQQLLLDRSRNFNHEIAS
jgi:hypothetical protein